MLPGIVEFLFAWRPTHPMQVDLHSSRYSLMSFNRGCRSSWPDWFHPGGTIVAQECTREMSGREFCLVKSFVDPFIGKQMLNIE